MAQIKNIKKPGDLIRGASVGLAGLDKDGNVIGTGIDTKDIAAFPEGAQSGDVLAWGGETGPEWRPHYPESGSEGDVLTLGETGPEWNTPTGGGKVYLHYCYFGTFTVVFPVEKSTPFTKEEFIAYVTTLCPDTTTRYKLTGNGYYYDSTYGYQPLYVIELKKQFSDIIFDNRYIRFDGDGKGSDTGHSFTINSSGLSNFTDTVLPIS